MFYCLKGGYALKKTPWKWLHEVSYLFYCNDSHIQCTQFLSQKIILRGCWGYTFFPESGNPAVLSASYIITVIKNLFLDPSWQRSWWCQRQKRQWVISIPVVLLLTSLQLCLGSPQRAELLCNTLSHITTRNFLWRSHFSVALPILRKSHQIILKWQMGPLWWKLTKKVIVTIIVTIC